MKTIFLNLNIFYFLKFMVTFVINYISIIWCTYFLWFDIWHCIWDRKSLFFTFKSSKIVLWFFTLFVSPPFLRRLTRSLGTGKRFSLGHWSGNGKSLLGHQHGSVSLLGRHQGSVNLLGYKHGSLTRHQHGNGSLLGHHYGSRILLGHQHGNGSLLEHQHGSGSLPGHHHGSGSLLGHQPKSNW